jgi:hypothetical protein
MRPQRPGLRLPVGRGASLLAALALGGCAGLPIGGHSYVYVGVGVVHIDKSADATGIGSTMVGLAAGCGQVTLGAVTSFCAALPEHGSVAIIDRAHTAKARLTVQPSQPRSQP